jgi:hypothetical protein
MDEKELYPEDLMRLWEIETQVTRWAGNPHPAARGRMDTLGGMFHSQRAYVELVLFSPELASELQASFMLLDGVIL